MLSGGFDWTDDERFDGKISTSSIDVGEDELCMAIWEANTEATGSSMSSCTAVARFKARAKYVFRKGAKNSVV